MLVLRCVFFLWLVGLMAVSVWRRFGFAIIFLTPLALLSSEAFERLHVKWSALPLDPLPIMLEE